MVEQESLGDEAARRLAAFADALEMRLGDAVDIDRDGSPALAGASLWPSRKNALSVTWTDFGQTLQVEAGHGRGGVWELGREPEDLDFIEDLVNSVVAGRVVEVFGHRRSRVEVTLSDGSLAVETGYGPGGCLPRPGWRRRGCRVQYAPYE